MAYQLNSSFNGTNKQLSDHFHWDMMNGTINEAFSESSFDLTGNNNNKPSIFYVDDTTNWMDKSLHGSCPRFTEHWLDLENSLNPIESYDKRPRLSSQSSSWFNRCSCQKFCCYCCIPLIVTLSLFGFIVIIGVIFYLETYARQVDHHPFAGDFTNGRRPFDLTESKVESMG